MSGHDSVGCARKEESRERRYTAHMHAQKGKDMDEREETNVEQQALLSQREKAVQQREDSLLRRENALMARELLADRHLPKEALNLIDLATPDTVKTSLAALETLRSAFAPAAQAPRTGGQADSTPNTYAHRAMQYLQRRGY